MVAHPLDIGSPDNPAAAIADDAVLLYFNTVESDYFVSIQLGRSVICHCFALLAYTLS